MALASSFWANLGTAIPWQYREHHSEAGVGITVSTRSHPCGLRTSPQRNSWAIFQLEQLLDWVQLVVVPWLCPSPAQEIAKRCSSLARGLWHAVFFSRCPVPLCARAGRPRGSAPSEGDLLTAPGSPENVELVLSGAMKCGRTPFFFFLQWKSLKS